MKTLLISLTALALVLAVYSPASAAHLPPYSPPTASDVSMVHLPFDPLPFAYRTMTIDELREFLQADPTNEVPPGPDMECVQYSEMLVHAARDQGYEAWMVGAKFENTIEGHAFVAFRVVDRGIVYIEPQLDGMYLEVAVGKQMCLSGWKCLDNPEVGIANGPVTELRYCTTDSRFCVDGW
jgi:hypothetical protein